MELDLRAGSKTGVRFISTELNTGSSLGVRNGLSIGASLKVKGGLVGGAG